MDQRILRLYAFLLKMERIALIDIPEPYQTELS